MENGSFSSRARLSIQSKRLGRLENEEEGKDNK